MCKLCSRNQNIVAVTLSPSISLFQHELNNDSLASVAFLQLLSRESSAANILARK